jgi:hypothetical protein
MIALLPGLSILLLGGQCGPSPEDQGATFDCGTQHEDLRPPRSLDANQVVAAHLTLTLNLTCDTTSSHVGMQGDTIIWSVTAGGGTLTSDTSVTDAQGRATTDWTLGREIGSQGADGRTLSGTHYTFTAMTFGLISVTGGDQQVGDPGSGLTTPLEVRYVDGNNQPAAGRTVLWSTGNGSGTVSPGIATTNNDGRSTGTWTLGPAFGTQTATATVQLPGGGGPSVTFNATARGTASLTCTSPGGGVEPERITSNTTWTRSGSPHRLTSSVSVVNGAVLTIEPGALICAGPHVALVAPADFSGADLTAIGTAADPIRFEAIDPTINWLGIEAANASQLRWVRITRADQAISAGTGVVIDQALVTEYGDLGIKISGLNTMTGQVTGALTNSTVSYYTGSPTDPGVGIYLAFADAGYTVRHVSVQAAGLTGILIAGGSSSISDCQVTAGIGVGLSFQSVNPLSVNNCNITGNLGNGVESNGAITNAEGNWWGDPTGPTGAGGDGIGSSVDASNYLTAPAVLGAFPAPPVMARGLGDRPVRPPRMPGKPGRFRH